MINKISLMLDAIVDQLENKVMTKESYNDDVLEKESGIMDIFRKAKELGSKLGLPLSAIKQVVSMRPTKEELDQLAEELKAIVEDGKKQLPSKEAFRVERRPGFYSHPFQDPQSYRRQKKQLKQTKGDQIRKPKKSPSEQSEHYLPSQNIDRPYGFKSSRPFSSPPSSPSMRPSAKPSYPSPPSSTSPPMSPSMRPSAKPLSPSLSSSPLTEPSAKPLSPSSIPRSKGFSKYRIGLIILILLLFGQAVHRDVAQTVIPKLPTLTQTKLPETMYPIVQPKTITIEFAFDKDNIGVNDRGEDQTFKIDEIVNYINENPSSNVELSGHASKPGGNEYNKKLSERRARSVEKSLKDRIPNWTGNVVVRSYGEEKNLGKTNQENQVVIVKIVPQEASKTASINDTFTPRPLRVVLSYLSAQKDNHV